MHSVMPTRLMPDDRQPRSHRSRARRSVSAPPSPSIRRLPGLDELARIVEHRSHRKFAARPVDPGLLRLLFACALSAPSKSDLQQADIVHVADRAKVARDRGAHPRHAVDRRCAGVARLLRQQPPHPADRRVARQAVRERSPRSLHERGGRRRHRDDDFHPRRRSGGARRLPDQRRAQPAARSERAARRCRSGSFRWRGSSSAIPAKDGRITPRLPLEVTVHVDRYDESRVRENVDAYDRRRHALLPYRKQRGTKRTAKRRSTAGRRTRRGSTRCRSARISAPSSARRGFNLD